MRAYLNYQMTLKGVSRDDLRKVLGVSEKTVRNKLTGETDFTWSEAKKIKKKFFPEEDYEKLFENIDG